MNYKQGERDSATGGRIGTNHDRSTNAQPHKHTKDVYNPE